MKNIIVARILKYADKNETLPLWVARLLVKQTNMSEWIFQLSKTYISGILIYGFEVLGPPLFLVLGHLRNPR
jgi:hypothetical protein